MVLEHLIVSRMKDSDEKVDDGETDDVENVLKFGAQALFEGGEEESANDIRYTDADLDSILDRSEKDALAAKEKTKAATDTNKAFTYAKIWERDGLQDMKEDIEEDVEVDAQRGFWAKILEQQQLEQQRLDAEAATKIGRGKRERKQIVRSQTEHSGVNADSRRCRMISAKCSKTTSVVTVLSRRARSLEATVRTTSRSQRAESSVHHRRTSRSIKLM